MSVFVAAADESAAGDGTGDFFFGGFVAPQHDWDTYFTPAWRERVLETKPRLSHLHVTEIQSKSWREKNGISETAANRKLDEAFRVIGSSGSLYPITAQLNATHLRSEAGRVGLRMMIRTPGGLARKNFDPDYLCFVRFALHALLYAHETVESATRVDFVVEDNGQLTRHIGTFHAALSRTLTNIGRQDLAQLVGAFIPAGKGDVRLQAADLMCWYARRSSTLDLTPWDARRFYRFLVGRKGMKAEATEQEIDEMIERAQLENPPPADADGWIEAK
jgi:hypothetical protein